MAQSTRTKRRIIGMLAKRLGEARLDEVADPRDTRGRRWSLPALLSGALLGLVAGSRNLKEVEALTDELTPAVARRLGIPRRLPDTTLRDALSMLSPDDLRPLLHATVRAASRRKALEPDDLPFGVVALDGKDTMVPACDDFYAQRHVSFQEDDHPRIEQNPRATVVVMVLRRIAYTLLALWRYVTLRSDEQRQRPWRKVMRDIELTVIEATAGELAGLRRHRLATPPA